MSDRLEEAKLITAKYKDTCEYQAMIDLELLQWLIAEVERLRGINKILDNLANINLKGPDIRIADPKEVRAKLIRQQQRKIESLKSQLAAARPGWCHICHERIYNKVNEENKKLQERVEDTESKLASIIQLVKVSRPQ